LSTKKVGASTLAGLVMLTASMMAIIISKLYFSDPIMFTHGPFYPYLYVGWLNMVACFLAIISGILMFFKKHLFSIIFGVAVTACGFGSWLIFLYFGTPWKRDYFLGLPLIVIAIVAIAIAGFDYLKTRKIPQK
jgi:hypothetical protein